MASTNQVSDSASALIKYGREFRPLGPNPPWLRVGARQNCFNNSLAYAVVRSDVSYAEGYAIEPDLVIPVHHAWLVDSTGRVIDPTWSDTTDHLYFGIAFKRDFVIETMKRNGNEAGILVNFHLLRRRYRTPQLLEEAIKAAQVE